MPRRPRIRFAWRSYGVCWWGIWRSSRGNRISELRNDWICERQILSEVWSWRESWDTVSWSVWENNWLHWWSLCGWSSTRTIESWIKLCLRAYDRMSVEWVSWDTRIRWTWRKHWMYWWSLLGLTLIRTNLRHSIIRNTCKHDYWTYYNRKTLEYRILGIRDSFIRISHNWDPITNWVLKSRRPI